MPIRISGSTGISGIDGSAQAPAVQGSNPNAGVYYSGNTVFVSTSGTNALTIGPSGNVDFSNTSVTIGGQTISSATGMRNRIINGDMKIDQRYAGSAVTVSSSAAEWYIVDRTLIEIGGISGTFGVVQRVTDAPTGFSNSLKYTANSSITYNGSIGWMGLNQRIEGQNLQDFAWGTASATKVTLSFWVKASITGTYTACLMTYNGSQSRMSNIKYTVNASNTWEYKSITFDGDTNAIGGIANDNGANGWIRVYWVLGGQSGSFTATSFNTWFNADGTKRAGSDQVNMLGTNGSTFQITGVQLEKGSVATPFEFRQYGTELTLCQRYYQKIAGGDGLFTYTYTAYYPTWRRSDQQFIVPMRATPTMTGTISTDGGYNTSSIYGNSSWSFTMLFVLNATNSYGYYNSITASAEL